MEESVEGRLQNSQGALPLARSPAHVHHTAGGAARSVRANDYEPCRARLALDAGALQPHQIADKAGSYIGGRRCDGKGEFCKRVPTKSPTVGARRTHRSELMGQKALEYLRENLVDAPGLEPGTSCM